MTMVDAGLDGYKARTSSLANRCRSNPDGDVPEPHNGSIDGTGVTRCRTSKASAFTSARRQRHRSHGVRVIEAARLDKDKAKRERLGVAGSVNAPATKIDAFFWVGGLPTRRSPTSPALRVKVRMIDHDSLVGR
jgi:hypothetical protein